ncbi:Lsr2 family DNA-binding protein [Geodermatophilus obscurus]|uniref:Lsr2 family DNA-binding protein n=1 Tax=Geodermatophilus obscurus TaxID=1861 RepID=UPI003C7C4443
MRAWAAAKGYEVSNRGRIPAAVVEAYQAAGTDPFREIMPKHDAGRCPFGSSPSRSASTRSI